MRDIVRKSENKAGNQSSCKQCSYESVENIFFRFKLSSKDWQEHFYHLKNIFLESDKKYFYASLNFAVWEFSLSQVEAKQ